jgi:hypothetical protein
MELGPYCRAHRHVTVYYMKGQFLRRNTVTRAMRAELADDLAQLGRPIAVNDRACCCPARPMVSVVMPPTASRPYPIDLLLCGHHYRVSRAALRAAGATVYDQAGRAVTGDTSGHQHSRHQPAGAAPRP